MYNCNHCGGFVTRDFARVFGSNTDEVYACPACATFQSIAQDGLAARPADPAWA